MLSRPLVGLALLALALGGCASLRAASSAPTLALSASVPTPDQLAAPYRAQAEQRERDGALRQAAEAWLTALALAPDHEPSRAALKRLRARIEREVAQHLQRGRQAVAREQSAGARRHFQAALALDPDSRPAQHALRATSPPDARPGAPIRSETNGGAATSTAAPSESDKPSALYALAKRHLAEGLDEEAYRALTQLTRVSPGYGDSARLLRELRPRLVQQRYQEGLRLFREEQIENAIEKWRGVLELDPDHANAQRNIEQAEKMLRTLAAQPKR